jgi:hypothetical protein
MIEHQTYGGERACEPHWAVHLHTPVGTISVQDRNEQPGGPRGYDEDEITIALEMVPRSDWKRLVVLIPSGGTFNLGELLEAAIARDGT